MTRIAPRLASPHHAPDQVEAALKSLWAMEERPDVRGFLAPFAGAD